MASLALYIGFCLNFIFVSIFLSYDLRSCVFHCQSDFNCHHHFHCQRCHHNLFFCNWDNLSHDRCVGYMEPIKFHPWRSTYNCCYLHYNCRNSRNKGVFNASGQETSWKEYNFTKDIRRYKMIIIVNN